MASGAVALAAAVAISSAPADPALGRPRPSHALTVVQLVDNHPARSSTAWRRAFANHPDQVAPATEVRTSDHPTPQRHPTSIHAGPATARVLAGADFDGFGARVYDRGTGQVPACVIGADNTASQVQAADAVKCGG